MKFLKVYIVISTLFIIIPSTNAAECQIEAEVKEAKVTLADTKITVKISKIEPINDVIFKGFNCNEEYKSSLEQSKLSYADERKTTLEQGSLIRGTVQTQLDDKSSDSRLLKVEITGKTEQSTPWWPKLIDSIKIFFKL